MSAGLNPNLNPNLNQGLDQGLNPGRRKDRIPIRSPSSFREVKVFFLCFSLISLASFLILRLDSYRILSRLPRMVSAVGKLAVLDFRKIDLLGQAALESVSVTILSVFYSLAPGILLGVMMANNITRNKILRGLCAGFCSLIRAVPTTVWVLIALACLGFGPGAGIVGMGFHTTVFLARAFQQSFENVPADSLEALSAAGANRVQIFCRAILPSAFAGLVAWCAIRFESNFSESTVLGMVGAGGIGYTVMACVNNYEYGRAGLAILVLLLLSYGFELMAARLKTGV
ncbi:MAG: ABC transporter permease subunit [Peptococcaceae bacterium]|nr:ABC transporter permease subunit [Peptococcaceae bacterium]